MATDLFLLIVFPWAVAFAAASDLFTMTISNRVSLVLVAAFAPAALLVGLPPEVMAAHLGAGVAMLVLGFGLFAAGWIGGGDAKLFAATALWFGWGGLLEYALLSALFGGGLTLAILYLRETPVPAPLVGQEWYVRIHNAEKGIPYGIALAVAALILYPETPFFRFVFG